MRKTKRGLVKRIAWFYYSSGVLDEMPDENDLNGIAELLSESALMADLERIWRS